ncbi:sensor histidine kinase [Chelatococcus reniformis]|uniref:histidine kinase n=1 Tax=Chelatococcus reniformis TaxID=1494448 RepID=A0A916UI88_9HYPH|nr:sensor histidine kinase [Chelatococcus reniformis]GGC73605.1 ATPase [Chelatococcus reniformis]
MPTRAGPSPSWLALGRRSIATRLFASAVFWCLFILVIAGLILSALYRRTSERAFDERLQVYLTDIVADLAAPGAFETKELGAVGEPRFELPLSGWYWQVSRLDGGPRDVRASRSLFGAQLRSAAESPVKGQGEVVTGYENGLDDRRLRVVGRRIDLAEDGRFDVLVAGPADEIEAAISQFTFWLTVTFILLGCALVLTTMLQVKFGLEPLSRLRRSIEEVRHGDADKIAGEYPVDVAPLAVELNLLIDANREILGRARTQVGNLAHALKTPLSVIVNEADGAEGDLAAKMRDQASLMRDQINYYLDRARAAALAGTLGTVTDIGPVIEALGRTLGKIYGERGLAVDVRVPEGARFRGEIHDFQDMAGNLADNAFKWAASELSLHAEVVLAGDKSMVVLTVDDDGPGLPENVRDEAVARGRRLDESKPGSGLGLSIVAELAELYGGSLELGTSPLGGLRAVLKLPAV